uniref:Ysc84 actin-binding domain-containing protein n=1 Tax=Chlorobium chlorochromatii (strain CaD3) TaxID=340177 RepID=Q3APF1_CHLCH
MLYKYLFLMKFISFLKSSALALFLTLPLALPAEAGWDPAAEDRARVSVEYFKTQWTELDRYFSQAYGYAVFPDVYKGGLFFIGGAHGKGYVFEQTRLVGTSTITQLNAGPQLGGQSFSEIIFFKGQEDLERFKQGNFEFGAHMSAIVVNQSIATNTDYSNGVAVFVFPKAGVMVEASVGGQKFSYHPN